MNDKPNKERQKIVPKVGGKKKKKKKKKKGKKPNDEPQQDPHFRATVLNQQQTKPKPKRQRRTKFEADVSAPTIQISGGFNDGLSAGRRYGNSGGSGKGKGKGKGGQRRSGKGNTNSIPNRRPRGTRTAVPNTGATNPMNRIYTNLEKAEQTVKKRVFSPKILEDNSGNEDEEKKQSMETDHENKNDNNIENIDYDPWNNSNNDNECHKYTPITLKQKANYGKHGIFLQTEMMNVFTEKEYGNEFMFMQLPPVLPLASHLNEDEKLELANNRAVEQSLLRQMGEGQIGKIRIRKSGKTEFVIGDCVMDVNFASPMDCYQQIMHIHCENTMDREIKGKSQLLGDVPPQNNLVCSYRAKDLLLQINNV